MPRVVWAMSRFRTVIRRTVILVTVVLAGCTAFTERESAPPAVVLPHLSFGNIDPIRFNEPSGICWHSGRESLFVVGDEGCICEIKADGSLVRQQRIRNADFEGITSDPSTGLLYVAVEGSETIIEIDPETLSVVREFSIPRAFDGAVLMKYGGYGIEGITFVPDSAHREGGTFYVVNQSMTQTMEDDISAVFEVELPLRSNTGEPALLGFFAPGVIDLSGLHYDRVKDQIIVISDATNTILEYSREFRLMAQHALPGQNQEGLTVDESGFMYIAQDSGGILKLQWLRGE
jgi:DNA-binding beta-propeller fold protein YncE